MLQIKQDRTRELLFQVGDNDTTIILHVYPSCGEIVFRYAEIPNTSLPGHYSEFSRTLLNSKEYSIIELAEWVDSNLRISKFESYQPVIEPLFKVKDEHDLKTYICSFSGIKHAA